MDLTMLITLSSIGSQQSKPTKKTMSELVWFLDYCTTNPDSVICYHTSDIVLWTENNASYLSETNACSCTRGLFYLSD